MNDSSKIPTTRARGRKPRGPYKFTRKVRETILRVLKAGGCTKHAAEAAEIDYSTLRDWLSRGEAGDATFRAFATECRKLRAEHALRLQSIVTRAALGPIPGDWRAALVQLERLFPKEWSPAAMHAAASVTVRSGAAANSGSNDEGIETRLRFTLPSNGRRPDDEEAP